jgi:phosphoribosyl-ATP pyrophosphohydrolase
MAKVETVTLRHFFPASILQQFLIGGSAQLSYFCFLLFLSAKISLSRVLDQLTTKKKQKK